MKKKISALILVFLMMSINWAGLSSFFRKILKPVFAVSESVIGKITAESIKLQGVYKSDPKATQWVQGIFNKVVKEGQKEYKGSFDITILKAKYVNAMATPGGHVFVTYGLLQKIKSDDELAAVLGHEVGHVVAGHSIKSIQHQVAWYAIMKYAKKRSTSHKSQIQTLGAVYSMFSSLRYSRKNESESDYLGARYAAQAGYNPKGAVGVMEMFKSMEKKEPSRMQAILRSHPLSSKRSTKMRNYMNAFSSETTNRPMKLSYDFAKHHPKKKKEDKKKTKKVVTSSKVVVKKKTSKEITGKIPLKQINNNVYEQNFNTRDRSYKIAKGLTIKDKNGLFSLLEDKKIKGDLSQRIVSYSFRYAPSLVSSRFIVKGDTSYILQGRIKVDKIRLSKLPTGEGACVIVNEMSRRSFVRGHLPQFLIKNSSKNFLDVYYKFKTKKKTNFLTLEYRIQGAKGYAWFDDFVVKEVKK
ncbi:MAG: hypothetical protein COB02_08040 [Candidatus Cloacimonadota bacterium]|nr:MAG: hypothetical protein COB02_08040 [Candidatus Cloacimonadota bacterium]